MSGRGMWVGDNRLFVASGYNVFEVFQDGTFVMANGYIGVPLPPYGIPDATITTPVQFFSPTSGKELFIVASGLAFVYTGADILPVYADDGSTERLTALTGAYLDGYYIVAKPDSRQFNIFGPIGSAGYEDSAHWNPLDFAIKEGASDNISAIFADHSELWIFGRNTTEVWSNTGNANFPFSRIQGAFTEQGCAATWSVAKVANSIMCLGATDRGGGVVWSWEGFIPRRVSNHAVELAIQNYSQISDAIAFSYQDMGHFFYVLNFPAAKATWVYDATTQQWHEREFWNRLLAQPEDVLGRYHAFVWGKHFVQDRRSGVIYEQSTAYCDDAGEPIRRIRSAPHISNELKWIKFPSLTIDMQTGKSPSVGRGSDPVVILQISDDGGYTWGNEISIQAGKIGEYLYRIVWRRLGRSRKRCYKVTITDPIPICFVEAYSEAVAGK